MMPFFCGIYLAWFMDSIFMSGPYSMLLYGVLTVVFGALWLRDTNR